MKKVFSLSVAAMLALAVPAGAADAADCKPDKIDLFKNCLTSDVCFKEITNHLSGKFPCFDMEIIFPDCDNGTDEDNGSTPDSSLPEQDTETPDTSLPEVDTDKPDTKPEEDDSQNGSDSLVPPSEPDLDLPEEDDTQGSVSSLNEYEREVIKLVNEIRVENGLGELAIDEELSRVARIKSQDMKDNNYFSHTSPTYGSPFDMMQQFGISYSSAGENIAKGQSTPQAVVDAWMNSEGHRKNILNSSFNTIGMGYVAQGNYWTQMFIGR